MKVVIIGGVAGGASCATRLRRLDESAEIVILERGDNVSYANCGLPYYVGGRIEREESLTVASPGFLRARFNIDVRVRSEAVGIDTARKTVRVRERDGREYDEPYDKLLLAPGAAAKTFGWSGEGIFVLRDVADATGMAAYIREKGVKSALVAGGGFIGIETAENLAERGIAVTLAEFAPQVMPPLDPEMALLVRDELEKGGVKVMTGVGVGSVLSSADGVKVKFTDGGEGTFGMVVLALGVTPETALAKDAGIELTSLGGIKVDGTQRTSVPDIFAAGDATGVIGADGGEALVPLAGPANRQGRSAADNMTGARAENGGRVLGASVVRVFGLTAASVGRNEKQLKKAGKVDQARKFRDIIQTVTGEEDEKEDSSTARVPEQAAASAPVSASQAVPVSQESTDTVQMQIPPELLEGGYRSVKDIARERRQAAAESAAPEKCGLEIDPKKLVIYSEIMKPKFDM